MRKIQPVIIQHLHATRLGVVLILGVGIAVIFCQSPVAVAADAGSALHSPPSDKQKAAHPARDWKKLPDFAELRREYGNRDDFDKLCGPGSAIPNAMNLLKNKKWVELLHATDATLNQCPVDIDAHVLQAIALSGLSRKAEAKIHRQWWHGLVESILNSGDGRSPETAWVVISVSEEYSILHALGLQSHGQAVLNHNIDALKVAWKGEMITLFFNFTASARRMDKAFNKNRPNPKPDESGVE